MSWVYYENFKDENESELYSRFSSSTHIASVVKSIS